MLAARQFLNMVKHFVSGTPKISLLMLIFIITDTIWAVFHQLLSSLYQNPDYPASSIRLDTELGYVAIGHAE